jgi:proline iminopeptidase
LIYGPILYYGHCQGAGGRRLGLGVALGLKKTLARREKHLILANTFHSYVMWQENDDNSNREIQVNYSEVWDTLMKIRERGAISSDQIHQEIYGKVPYGFLYAYNPNNFRARGRKPYPNPFNSALYYQMVGKDGDFIVGNGIGNFDFRKQLKSLPMPILIVAGRYDRVAVPWMMVKYKTYCHFVLKPPSLKRTSTQLLRATFDCSALSEKSKTWRSMKEPL